MQAVFINIKLSLVCLQAESNKPALRSFWIPSLTPSTETDITTKPVKMSPICPGSTDKNRHEYSLKTLVDVHFTEEKVEDGSGEVSRICPSCKKVLTNGLKAMRTSYLQQQNQINETNTCL